MEKPRMCIMWLLCLLLSSGEVLGSTSNAGSEFYIGFMKAFESGELTISINVTTTESVPVHFTVSNHTSTIYSGTVHNNSVTEIALPGNYTVSNVTERRKGLQIQVTDAGKTILAYGMNYQPNNADGFLVLPCNKYRVENYTYFAVSTQWDRTSDRLSSEVLLVGCEDNTEVTITPTQTIQIPSDLVRGGNSALNVTSGESYTITLNKMETFQFNSVLDLTGSKATSSKPVAFFTGHECADVPINVPACDHLVEQLPPTVTWGQLFFTSSLKNRTSGEWYKVIGSKHATTVVVYCVTAQGLTTTNFVINLNEPGHHNEFNTRQNMFCSIQASKPVMVVQFAAGLSFESPRYGDPFMMMIPPVEQYKNNYTLVSQSNFDNFLTITVPIQFYDPSMIFLNGTALTSASWNPMYCSSVDICGYTTRTSISSGTSHIQHENPNAVFGAVVYGFEVGVSYGYPAGMELDSIENQVCQHGEVRLLVSDDMPNQPVTAGIVQVCQDGGWTYMCGRRWSNEDAATACRQLGYSPVDAVAFSVQVGESELFWPIFFSGVECRGSEFSLMDCHHHTNSESCSRSEASGVECQLSNPPALFQIHLVGVGNCREWMSDLSASQESVQAVSTAVVENIERLCHCGILERDITNSTFICYSDNADKVIFRAELSAPVPYINLSTVFSYLSQWVEGGAHITIAGKLLTVDPTCSVETQLFMEQGCQSDTPVTVESILAPAVGGGVAALIFLIVTAVVLVVSVMAVRNCRSTATETNEPTDIPMKENAAYEDVTKFKAVQKDENRVYDTVGYQY